MSKLAGAGGKEHAQEQPHLQTKAIKGLQKAIKLTSKMPIKCISVYMYSLHKLTLTSFLNKVRIWHC